MEKARSPFRQANRLMDSGSVVKSTGKGNGWAIMVTNTKVSGTKAKGMVKVATNGLRVMNSRRTEGCIMKVSGRWIKDTVAGDTTSYSGQWQGDRYCGQGVYRHQNKTYKGTWLNGERHGTGIVLDSAGVRQDVNWVAIFT